jgi:hypothetical protein
VPSKSKAGQIGLDENKNFRNRFKKCNFLPLVSVWVVVFLAVLSQMCAKNPRVHTQERKV